MATQPDAADTASNQYPEFCQQCTRQNTIACNVCRVDGARKASPNMFLVKQASAKRSVENPAQPGMVIQVPPGYEELGRVLEMALTQAARGKGHVRHSNGLPFQSQRCMTIARLQASPAGPLFQAHKKLHEGEHFSDPTPAIHEFLGAINYIAFAVLLAEEGLGFQVGLVKNPATDGQ